MTEGPTTTPVVWALRSSVLESPLAETTIAGDTEGATAADSDGNDASFPYLVLVVALLVVLGIIAATGVFRSWRSRSSASTPVWQQKEATRERDEHDAERRRRAAEQEFNQLGEAMIPPSEPEDREVGDDRDAPRTIWSTSYLDTDDDGAFDKERVVEHREGLPDRVTISDYHEQPVDPLTKAYAEWAAEQIFRGDDPNTETDEEQAERR